MQKMNARTKQKKRKAGKVPTWSSRGTTRAFFSFFLWSPPSLFFRCLINIERQRDRLVKYSLHAGGGAGYNNAESAVTGQAHSLAEPRVVSSPGAG